MSVDTIGSRVAVVGAGHWGRNVIRSFATLGALGCVVDLDERKARESAGQWEVPSCSLERALSDPRIGAVAVVTPVASHYAIALAALRAGKHVFVEKTFTSSEAQARDLVETAGKAGLVLMVGHLLRYHPAYLRARELLRSGEFGRLRYVYSNRLSHGLFRGAEDALWDLAAHDVSMILDLAQAELTRLEVSGDCIDFPGEAEFAHLHLGFANGIRGHVFTSRLHPFKEHRLVLVMDKGSIVFEDSASEPDRKLVLFDQQLPASNRQPVVAPGKGSIVPYERSEPLLNECEHFLNCVETGDCPATDGVEGLRVMRVIARAAKLIKPAMFLAEGARPLSNAI